MSELTVGLLRLGYLALLWLLVLSSIAVLRRDLYGTRIVDRRRNRTGGAPAAAPAPTPAPARRSKTAGPTRLVVTEGPLRGTVLPLGAAPVLIGRSPGCTLVLDDDYSSSRHARLFLDGDQWFVEDLGSTNGTFLGDQRVSGPLPLGTGTPVRIGQNVLELAR
ncbi:FHA domain-containing protein FhaB/FipA [Cellulomonas citrea]|uniref:FHA domain-containing protein FhaB/FipA n=1 Tax=Cellulomonas citrea TaxID=1909423 RepID=UPI001359021B|nr:FHA domain-containing protein [Cellulomonas citrea]